MTTEVAVMTTEVAEMTQVAARPHPFPLALASAALLVIDMQNDFCHPDGYCLGTLGADAATARRVRGIIPRIERVRDWARQNTLPVFYTRESHRSDLSDLTASKRLRYENAGYPVGSQGRMGRFLVQGEPGCAIIDELTPAAGETALDKPAHSAFVGTSLETALRGRGITHLLLTGLTTQCCVLATYRAAADLGFWPLLLEDCCAAFDARDHQAAVDVLTSEGGAVGWVAAAAALFAIGKEETRCEMRQEA